MRDAFADRRLLVYFQPEVDLRDNYWHAAEALLRWQDEDGLVHAAGDFIDIAEASGLIVPVGRWVLDEACRAAKDWPSREGIAPIDVVTSRKKVVNVARDYDADRLRPTYADFEGKALFYITAEDDERT